MWVWVWVCVCVCVCVCWCGCVGVGVGVGVQLCILRIGITVFGALVAIRCVCDIPQPALRADLGHWL